MFLFRLLFSLFSTNICVSSKCNLGLVAHVNRNKIRFANLTRYSRK